MLRFLKSRERGLATKKITNIQYWTLIALRNLSTDNYQKFKNLLETPRAHEAIFIIINSDKNDMLNDWLNGGGGDPNVVVSYEDGRSLRHYKTCPLLEAIRLKDESMVRTLLSAGAKLNALDEHGIDITLAAKQGGSIGVMAIIENHQTGEAEATICERLKKNFANNVRIVNWPTIENISPRSTRTNSI